MLIGISSLIICLAALLFARKRSYFLSKTDLRIHLIILIDLSLETFIYQIQKIMEMLTIIPTNQDFQFRSGHDFYICAITFAFIIGHFRYRKLKELTPS